MPVELPGEACARVKPELDRVGGHLLGYCRAEVNVKIGDDEDAPADADIRLEAPVRNVGARQQGPPKHEQARQWNEVEVYSLPLSAERRRIQAMRGELRCPACKHNWATAARADSANHGNHAGHSSYSRRGVLPLLALSARAVDHIRVTILRAAFTAALALGAYTTPLAAHAQQPAMPVIGYLS